MKSMMCALLLILGAESAGADEVRFYVGTYTHGSSSKGIYQGTLNTDNGTLGPLTLVAPAINPSFLALKPDGTVLYAADEILGMGRVSAFGRGLDGTLFPLNMASAGGTGTCHVSVDPTGGDVLVANYGSGSIACFRLKPDGSIGARTAMIQLAGSGPNPKRQLGPHAHSIYTSPDDAFVYACDLGSDKVWIFKFDAGDGTLVPSDPPFARVPPGSGPRHLAFNPNGKFVYVSNEMGHDVTVFTRNASTGDLTVLETVGTLPAGTPEGNVTTAEIALHPSGKWLYVSNRGCDTISAFAVGEDGRIKLIQSVAAGVKFPRNFGLDASGQWMITAGQNDGRIAVLKVDPASGRLSATDQSAQVGSPVCVLFEGK